MCNNFLQIEFRFREFIRELRDLELCKSALANAALPLKEIYNKNRLLFELHKKRKTFFINTLLGRLLKKIDSALTWISSRKRNNLPNCFCLLIMSLGWFDSWNKNFRKSRDTSNLIGMENWGFRQIYCTVIQICWGEGSTPNLSCGLLPYCTVSPAAASSQDHYCMSASRFTFRNTKKVTSGYTLQYTLYNNTLVKYWPKESVCGQHIKKKTIV